MAHQMDAVGGGHIIRPNQISGLSVGAGRAAMSRETYRKPSDHKPVL